jgi:transcriptional regulator with XRE-family HTH domain
MGTPNKILKEYLKNNQISVIQVSRDMGVSPARIYQWLDGETIPDVRIRNWIFDPSTPNHIRYLAKEMAKERISQ